MAKFEITTRKNGEHQFNLKVSNGQTILTSEGYASKSACLNGIDAVKKNSHDDSRFERKTATNGKAYFNLKAANNQIIGTSEMYESIASRDHGIESVKKSAPEAEISDLS